MVSKSLLLAVVASYALQLTSAQEALGAGAPANYTPTSNFPWKNIYPQPRIVPAPKAEWMALLDTSKIAQAPVAKKNPDGTLINPDTTGKDPFCAWSFSQCRGAEDIFSCQKGNWGLSFDDGPTPASPQLYDYLDSINAKATFFVIGGQVIQYPELLQRIHKAGHEIGLHTWSHSMLTSQTTEQIVAELKWTELAVKEVIGVSPKLMRPAYGDMDNRVRDIVKQLGFIPAIWNYDTFDWKLGTPGFDQASIEAKAKEWVAAAGTAQEGGVSLEHDLKKETIDVAIKIIPTLKTAYNLTTVGHCANLSFNQLYKETEKQNQTAQPGNSTNTKPQNAAGSLKDKALVGASLAVLSTLLMASL
ncbi:chitin deacetylase [Apophysomyces sp. BC1034]|nr:chitin deacetylase [Apophysomyces sp. BC1015]KAG0176057.1 chitin deacetylase [Apophysomyces sp. BC1021]KAG0186156.1 chitin deacetylase [Apophysomyces sp. BC1034]